MGLLVLAGVAALVLTLVLTLVTIAVVQLVLVVTLRNTLLLLVVAGIYWFVSSRRRQVAKGFYSCTEVPGSAKPTREKRAEHRVSTTREPKTATTIKADARPGAQDKEGKSGRNEQPVPRAGEPLKTETTAAETASVEWSGKASASEAAAITDGAESSYDQVLVAAAAALSPSSSSSLRPGAQLPDLRRRKWKFPTQSLPLKAKSAALLPHGRQSTGGSASNSPRRPELYGSPRSVAMEQKLMNTALEADGYWIGDFRVRPSLPKRSQSLGATYNAPTTAGTSSTSQTSMQTAPDKRYTAPRAV